MYGGNGCEIFTKRIPELKAIAMDSISYDSAITGGDEGFPCHHACWKQIVNRKNEHCFFLKSKYSEVIRCGKE